MNKPRVPLRPAATDALACRYQAAVAEIVEQADCEAGRRPPPSADPKHVFDTLAGLRLIVSLDRTPDGRIGTHLSASIHDGKLVRRECRDAESYRLFVIATWQIISRSDLVPTFLGTSEGGVAHFFLERGH